MSLSRHGVRTYLRECSPTVISAHEPLWTDPGLKSGISEWELISTLKKKRKKSAGREWMVKYSPKILIKIIWRKKNGKKVEISFFFWWGGGVAQLVEHQTGTLLRWVWFPDATRDFCPRGNFQCRLSYSVLTSLRAIACIYICAHVKDPTVHISIRWIMETLKHLACTNRLGSATVAAAFPQGRQPELPMGEIPQRQYSCKR